jgi:hypothetical protein
MRSSNNLSQHGNSTDFTSNCSTAVARAASRKGRCRKQFKSKRYLMASQKSTLIILALSDFVGTVLRAFACRGSPRRGDVQLPEQNAPVLPKAKTRWRWSWQHAGAEIRICDILNVARVVGVRQHALAVISGSTEIASDCCNARRDQNKPDRRQMLS